MPGGSWDQQAEDHMEFLLTLRRRGIGDQAVLRAMDEVPRGQFVEPEFAERAYADQALPIDCGQTISQPYVVAYMTEQLASARITACSRSAPAPAIRRRCCRGWPARWCPSSATARSPSRRARGSPRSATTMSRWWSATALPACRRARPTTASSSPPPPRQVPQTLLDQLADDGVMILPLGPHGGSQHIIKLTKSKTGIGREQLIAVRFVPLLPGQAQNGIVHAFVARTSVAFLPDSAALATIR